ncbi:MAG: type I glyceraldehyde-3-phosphate dehydrogenase [Anaerolineaceae bacterium]|nr:type I glyceraldehyde-3-phosphate dehydrogenase [Anaerolineaceae bacterium]
MTVKVGINGFGRIGRQVFKAMKERHGDELEIVAINDLYDVKTNAHLFKYDSNYGIYDGTVEVRGNDLEIDGEPVKVFAERNPGNLPWKDLGVEIVIESTGIFRDAIGGNGKPGANVHIKEGGAKKVIISAPAKNEDITIVLGVNDDKYDPAKHHVISNASCTTNCLAPAAKVVNDLYTIISGVMTTVHSYTNDQRLLDMGHSKIRRGRSAAMNIIPTTTGAAKAVALVIPELKGKFDGYALRVPTPTVSIVDLVVVVEKSTSKEELNAAFTKASESSLKGIMGVTTGEYNQPLVSMDFKGDSRSSIIDLQSNIVVGGNLIKVVTWYDNEWGYSCRTADLAAKIAKTL